MGLDASVEMPSSIDERDRKYIKEASKKEPAIKKYLTIINASQLIPGTECTRIPSEHIGSYGALHTLRAVAANIEVENKLLSGSKDNLNRMYSGDVEIKKFHHLISFSDCEGIYVPVDFEEVVWVGNGGEFSIGSATKLLSELKAIKQFCKDNNILPEKALSDIELHVLNTIYRLAYLAIENEGYISYH